MRSGDPRSQNFDRGFAVRRDQDHLFVDAAAGCVLGVPCFAQDVDPDTRRRHERGVEIDEGVARHGAGITYLEGGSGRELIAKLAIADFEQTRQHRWSVSAARLNVFEARLTWLDITFNVTKRLRHVLAAAFFDHRQHLGQKLLAVAVLVFDVDESDEIGRCLRLRLHDSYAARADCDCRSDRCCNLPFHFHSLPPNACAKARAHAARSNFLLTASSISARRAMRT